LLGDNTDAPSVNTLSKDRNKKINDLLSNAVCSARSDDFRFLTGGRTLGVVPVAVLFGRVCPFISSSWAIIGGMFLSAKIRSNSSPADASGLDIRYIGSIERGQRNPTFGVLPGIASVFGMKTSELLRKARL
jgi:Helix-turn-helix